MREQAKTVDDVAECTYAWSERKRQFSRRQIDLAIEVLSQKKWIGTLNTSESGVTTNTCA
ncbi:MAG: hypothetical protein OXF97_04995 [Nitrospira sp.]|nr:hypothetical protein [Nitrospira sp.]